MGVAPAAGLRAVAPPRLPCGGSKPLAAASPPELSCMRMAALSYNFTFLGETCVEGPGAAGAAADADHAYSALFQHSNLSLAPLCTPLAAAPPAALLCPRMAAVFHNLTVRDALLLEPPAAAGAAAGVGHGDGAPNLLPSLLLMLLFVMLVVMLVAVGGTSH